MGLQITERDIPWLARRIVRLDRDGVSVSEQFFAESARKLLEVLLRSVSAGGATDSLAEVRTLLRDSDPRRLLAAISGDDGIRRLDDRTLRQLFAIVDRGLAADEGSHPPFALGSEVRLGA